MGEDRLAVDEALALRPHRYVDAPVMDVVRIGVGARHVSVGIAGPEGQVEHDAPDLEGGVFLDLLL